MSKLGYSEVFYSLQGEGLFLGTPSIFLRLFGCNFRCQNYGQPKESKFGRYNPEVKEVLEKIDSYSSFSELPLVKTGCDSYGSVYPDFKRFAKFSDCFELAEQIINLLPKKKFDLNTHLIITGGEPLLPGWQKSLPKLFDILYADANLEFITFETNGTQILSGEFITYLVNSNFDVTFSVSSKLPCSGHSFDETVNCKAISQYYYAGTRIYFKWVVSSENDVEDVKKMIELYREGVSHLDDIPIYLMPVGGTSEGYFLNNKKIAEIAMNNGWRYSPRLQVELWKNAWGT